MRPSTVTTPRPSASASSNAAMISPGPFDLVVGRGEDPVARLELAGVDEGLAVEAQLPALHALGLEPLGVLDVVVDAVEDDLARGPGGEQARPGR